MNSNMNELIAKKDITIQDEFKSLSLIRELKATKMICVANCQLECSCFNVKMKKNNLCQLYNVTALNYLKEKNEVDNEFVYFKYNYKR